MNTLQNYTIIIRPDDNGTFIAHVPAIPGCHAYGKTVLEAQQELQNVFDMIQEEYEEEGKALPPDCEVNIVHAG
jgi:predicted RNase H-like HicB family nuclease